MNDDQRAGAGEAPTHCRRCEAYLDAGDVSASDPGLCVCCALILGGMDPYRAMHRAATIKIKRMTESESVK